MPGEGLVGCETGRIFRRSFYFLSFRVKSQEKNGGGSEKFPASSPVNALENRGSSKALIKGDFSWLTKRLSFPWEVGIEEQSAGLPLPLYRNRAD